jgi:hypothetical protein
MLPWTFITSEMFTAVFLGLRTGVGTEVKLIYTGRHDLFVPAVQKNKCRLREVKQVAQHQSSG